MINKIEEAFAHLQEQIGALKGSKGSSDHGWWSGEATYDLEALDAEAMGVMSTRKPDMVINRPGRSYLERWIERRDKELSLFLHRFRGSDPSDPHDHPADSISLCLWGEMKEQVFDSEGNLEFELPIIPGRIVCRTANLLHRLAVEPGKECLTLFVFNERTKPWGFKKNGEWIEHAEYKKMEGIK